MFKITAKCSKCGKEIQGNEEIYVKIHYPEKEGRRNECAFTKRRTIFYKYENKT